MQYRDHLNLKTLRLYARSLNQRAAKLDAVGELTAIILRSIILDSGGQCAWCESSIVNAEFEIEHIMPLTRGGTNQEDNLAVACPDCNRRKSNMHPAKFAQRCLNRTGVKSALIVRVLADYEMHPTQQRSLFETTSPESAPIDLSIDIGDDEDNDAPAPYVWE